ncbi:MAG: biotin synthase BioB, partial [Kocuria rhizophila]
IAGGREMHLRSLQAVGLQVANSIFLGDYLTSEGQDAEADLRMIADAGFTVLGAAAAPADDDGAPDGGCCGGGCVGTHDNSKNGAAATPSKPVLRRRGAGTGAAANA